TVGATDGTVAFSGTSLGTPENQIILTSAPGPTNGVLPRLTVNGADFATYASAQTLNATTVAQSSQITLTTGNTQRLVVGQILSGNASTPAGARIISILDNTIFFISVPAPASVTGGTSGTTGSTNFSLVGIAPFASYDNSANIATAAVA